MQHIVYIKLNTYLINKNENYYKNYIIKYKVVFLSKIIELNVIPEIQQQEYFAQYTKIGLMKPCKCSNCEPNDNIYLINNYLNNNDPVNQNSNDSSISSIDSRIINNIPVEQEEKINYVYIRFQMVLLDI